MIYTWYVCALRLCRHTKVLRCKFIHAFLLFSPVFFSFFFFIAFVHFLEWILIFWCVLIFCFVLLCYSSSFSSVFFPCLRVTHRWIGFRCRRTEMVVIIVGHGNTLFAFACHIAFSVCMYMRIGFVFVRARCMTQTVSRKYTNAMLPYARMKWGKNFPRWCI